MPRAELERLFPRLRESAFDIESPIDPGYNCAAFAVGIEDQWWDPYRPSGTWPNDVDREVSLKCFIEMFAKHGFQVCGDASCEEGFDKIALYVDAAGDFCHAARQHPSGSWVSKLGELEDIVHSTLEAISGRDYGDPRAFMKRPVQT